MVSHDAAPTWVRSLPTDAGPRLLHVNATAAGGGVAELLRGVVDAQRKAGRLVGWAVISGNQEFFALTKQIHHLLHGSGNPDVLDQRGQRELYRLVLRPQARWFARLLRPQDVVVLHDPQTLGMVPELARTGARVLWHCHIGTTDCAATGPTSVWRFFAEELRRVEAVLVTRPEFAPGTVHGERCHMVAPAIDLNSPKNRELTPAEVADLLAEIGLYQGDGQATAATVQQDRLLPTNAPMVLQVSRWDPLKDMAGVLRCLPSLPEDAHLVLAGPDPHEIPDDPEGLEVLDQVRALWRTLSPVDRGRSHLVILSMRSPVRNALLVNALQRRADVVLQKSLQEGFGLTLTEAMAKRCAVVAGDVGGLRLQVEHEVTGLLVDPTDQDAVVAAVRRLLSDPLSREDFGARAAEAAIRNFAMPRLVTDYERVLSCLVRVVEERVW